MVGAEYDAFISYSHAADRNLAVALQRGLSQFAKPWYRRRALHVFRDDTALAVSPHLWSSIVEALDGSRTLILMASPEAAASEWVNRELDHWTATKPDDRILPVVTAGDWVWDDGVQGFDVARSSAVPPALLSAFADEPRHLDLRWAKDEPNLALRNGRFRDAVAELAAPIRNVPKDELESEDLHLHRRAMRLARGAVIALLGLTVAALAAGVLAIANAHSANQRRIDANARGLAAQALATADDDLVDAFALGLAAHHTSPGPDVQRALLTLLQSNPRLQGFVDITHADYPTTDMEASSDGEHVVVLENHGQKMNAVVLSVRAGTRRIVASGFPIRVVFAGDEGFGITNGKSNLLRFYRWNGQQTWRATLEANSNTTVSPDTRRAVIEAPDGRLALLDLGTGRQLAAFGSAPAIATPTFSQNSAQVLVEDGAGLQLVEARTGSIVKTLTVPTQIGPVWSGTFMNGGAVLVRASDGGAVVHLDGQVQNAAVLPLEPAEIDDPLWTATPSTDGHRLLVATSVRTVMMDADSGRVLWQQPAAGRPWYAGFAADDTTVYEVAQTTDSGTLAVRDAATGAPLGELDNVYHRTAAVAERYAVVLASSPAAGAGESLVLVDLSTGRIAASYPRAGGFCSGNVPFLTSWSSDRTYLLTFDNCEEALLWTVSGPSAGRVEPLGSGARGVSAARFLAHDRLLTAGFIPSAVALWRLGPAVAYGHVLRQRAPGIVALDPNGKRAVIIHRIAGGYELVDSVSEAVRGRVVIAGTPDAGMVLAGTDQIVVERTLPNRTHALDLVDLDQSRVVATDAVCGLREFVDGSNALSTTADGRLLVASVGHPGGVKLTVCSPRTGQPVGAYEHQTAEAASGTVPTSPGGHFAAFAGRDGQVRVVDLRSKHQVGSFPWQAGLTNDAVGAFSPDGKLVAFAGYDSVTVFESSTRQIHQIRVRHATSVLWQPNHVVFDPSGRFAVLSVDTTRPGNGAPESELVAIDAKTSSVVGRVRAPGITEVTSLRASAGGKDVEVFGHTADQPGATTDIWVRWTLDEHALANIACRVLGGDPSRAEWSRRLPDEPFVDVCPQPSVHG